MSFSPTSAASMSSQAAAYGPLLGDAMKTVTTTTIGVHTSHAPVAMYVMQPPPQEDPLAKNPTVQELNEENARITAEKANAIAKVMQSQQLFIVTLERMKPQLNGGDNLRQVRDDCDSYVSTASVIAGKYQQATASLLNDMQTAFSTTQNNCAKRQKARADAKANAQQQTFGGTLASAIDEANNIKLAERKAKLAEMAATLGITPEALIASINLASSSSSTPSGGD